MFNISLRPHTSFLLVLVILTFLTGVAPRTSTATPFLESDSKVSSAGYFRLSWKQDTENDTAIFNFELQEADNPAFTQVKTLYSGPDTASLVSGRRNGIYYYRVGYLRDHTDPIWSNTQIVEVTHHPLSRAFMFFALGAIVFIATLTMVILGNKAHQQ